MVEKRPKLVSVSRVVRNTIDSDLTIQDAIQRGFGNVSAIARILKPRVEKVIGKKVTLDSLISSVKRTKINYVSNSTPIRSVVSRSIVSVRTGVVKLSMTKTKRAEEKVRRIMASRQEAFLQVSESINSITLILDESELEDVKEGLDGEEILEEEMGLSAIIVQSPLQIIKTPGCAITFYNQLYRSGINIEDTVSCYTDTIMVVKTDDAGKAFSVLTELISDMRKSVEKVR